MTYRTRIIILSFAVFGFGLLTGCATPPDTAPSAAPAGDYLLDPTHASVTWSLSHAGLSQYTARFDAITGALNFDPDAPQNSILTRIAFQKSGLSRIKLS